MPCEIIESEVKFLQYSHLTDEKKNFVQSNLKFCHSNLILKYLMIRYAVIEISINTIL